MPGWLLKVGCQVVTPYLDPPPKRTHTATLNTHTHVHAHARHTHTHTRGHASTALGRRPTPAGAINFTGDHPVVLTMDGPSLGGFICPATIISTELWKIGQVSQSSGWGRGRTRHAWRRHTCP